MKNKVAAILNKLQKADKELSVCIEERNKLANLSIEDVETIDVSFIARDGDQNLVITSYSIDGIESIEKILKITKDHNMIKGKSCNKVVNDLINELKEVEV